MLATIVCSISALDVLCCKLWHSSQHWMCPHVVSQSEVFNRFKADLPFPCDKLSEDNVCCSRNVSKQLRWKAVKQHKLLQR